MNANGSAALRPARVLIVDDNDLNIELARCLLEADGFEVESQTEPARVLAHLAVFQPALVLMDVQMPGTDGLTLTRAIKADAALRDTVVIAFTAYAMKGDEARMRSAGCDGYIATPIDVDRFGATVRAHLPAGPAVA